MMKRWKKLGLIYCPSDTGQSDKLLSHAANPLAVLIEGDVFRVFFSSRDARNRSSVGAVDIDLVTLQIVREYSRPFFQHGCEGSFYADGVSVGNCYEVNGVRYMLFMGWQNSKSAHWRGDIGRLIVRPDLTLELDSEVPLMGLDITDPISLSYPWVRMNPSGTYEMWYGSTLSWDSGNGEMLHVINYAYSSDGHHWSRQGLAVPYEIGKAQAFSRPTVARNDKGGDEMWFSYRSGTGDKYRIGHAARKPGKEWELSLNDAVLDVCSSGWDSEMIEYPFVFDHRGVRYMLYNGNGYGKTGFGLASMVFN